MDLIAKLTESQLKKDAVNFEVGDTVRVHAKIKEGNRERIQVFEGTVIAMKHGGIQEDCHRAPRILRRWCGKGFPRPLPQLGKSGSGPQGQSQKSQALLPA